MRTNVFFEFLTIMTKGKRKQSICTISGAKAKRNRGKQGSAHLSVPSSTAHDCLRLLAQSEYCN